VFPTTRGEWRGHADAIHPERELRPIVRDAGLPGEPKDWVPHSLRTTGASLEARVSGDLKSTMLRTRHRDPKVLLGYMRDVGRGLPPTALPAVEVPAAVTGLRVRQLPAYRVEQADPWGIGPDKRIIDVIELREEDLRVLQANETRAKRDQRNAQRQRHMGRDVANLSACWDQWTALGRPKSLPPRLVESLKKAYDRGYNAKLRGFRPVEVAPDWEPTEEQRSECRASGRRGRIGTLSIWERHKQKQLAVTEDEPRLHCGPAAAERAALKAALTVAHGAVTRAADALGRHPATIQRRIDALGLREWLTESYPRADRQPPGKKATAPHE
jgi:hypothetical protein